MLLLKRRFPPNQGRWAIPGGLVELGESVTEAALREVKEETGLEIKIESLLDVATDVHHDPAGRIKYHYVLVDYVARRARGNIRLNGESTEWGWFTRAESELLQMSEKTRAAVPRYFQDFSRTSARRARRKRSSKS